MSMSDFSHVSLVLLAGAAAAERQIKVVKVFVDRFV